MINKHVVTLDNNEKTVEESIQSFSEKIEATDKSSKAEIELPPVSLPGQEGGYGWFVVLGAFLVQITTFGTNTSWYVWVGIGVMQDYFEQNVFPNATIQLSFVGTIAMVCLNAMTPFVQICISIFGMHIVLIVGTVLIGLGLVMAGFSTQIWHLYLTQGVLFGVGASCIYLAILAATPQWFNKSRGLALGIVASGSGIGGLVIPFVMTSINASLGPGWTYRILGLVCLVCDILACILVKEKNLPAVRQRKRLSQMIDFTVFKNVNFLLFTVASDISLFGYFIPYFFLPSYATYLGLSAAQGSALVSVSSACNFVGRILMGFLADKLGKINTHLLFTFITALSCLLIWTFAFSYGSLMAFSAVFGLAGASYFALISPITASLLGMDQFPSGLSLLLFTNLISVFGSNVASAIEAGVDSAPFFSYKMFAGVSYLLAVFVIVILKFRLDPHIFAKV